MEENQIGEMSKSATFHEHGCRVVGLSFVDDVKWFSRSSIKKSKYGYDLHYIEPMAGWASHVIWGSAYSQNSYVVCGKVVEAYIEEAFRDEVDSLLLFTLEPNPSLVFECRRFSFLLAMSFMEWAGYYREFVVLSASRRLLFFRNEEFEYSLFSRDPQMHPSPFIGISDDCIRNAYKKDRADFHSELLEPIRGRHLESEILPFTAERSSTF